MRTLLSHSLVILALTYQVSTSLSQQALAENNRPLGPARESIFSNRLDLTTLPSPRFLPPESQTQVVNLESVVNLGVKFTECTLPDSSGSFDIGIVGHPFDLGVSFRPGARFGPNGVRNAGRRLSPGAGWSLTHPLNPFRSWATVKDCGDIYNTPFDKLQAIHELEKGMRLLTGLRPKNESVVDAVRLISIGGDHTITLPILRALHSKWGRVAVLHFDSHLDTWDPDEIGGGLNHGTMLHVAHDEELLSKNASMHLGLRCALFDKTWDLQNDDECGFSRFLAQDLDKIGIEALVKRIVDRVGDEYVYLSIDIDVLDPAFAPGTGTIEPGGWTTRELLSILQRLSETRLKIVGADVVEFSPIYDNISQTTATAVTEITYQILQWMVQVPVRTSSGLNPSTD